MTIKEIDQALEEGQSLKQITQAYSEIANLKIKRIRQSVERNRFFFEEISKVYDLIKNLAARRKVNILKPKQIISIVLTSNHRFYGKINSDLLDYFSSTTASLKTDYIILGKMGIDYFKTQQVIKNYQQVVLKDDQPDATELKGLVSLLKDYNQVLVFYSKMKSLLVQQPTATDISATSSMEISQQSKNEEFKFIFEPDLPKILSFFDSQIITLLLEAAFLESELSRTASRFISMDSAESEANDLIGQYQLMKSYAKRTLNNNAILETFASMMAVRKEI